MARVDLVFDAVDTRAVVALGIQLADIAEAAETAQTERFAALMLAMFILQKRDPKMFSRAMQTGCKFAQTIDVRAVAKGEN